MKKPSSKTIAGCLFALSFQFVASSVAANVPTGTSAELPFRPSHKDLQAAQNKQRAEHESRAAQRVAPEELDRSKTEEKSDRNIIEESTIIGYGGTWTIVPKGAVLHIPDIYKRRVGKRARVGLFVSWKDFLGRNPGWLHLQHLEMKQARGKVPMPEGIMDTYSSIGRVVIAVCHGGPISLREYQPPKAKPGQAEPRPANGLPAVGSAPESSTQGQASVGIR